MVRNSTGGSGTKGLARKHQVNNSGGRLRVSEDELEKYACVTKMLGNGMCEICLNDDTRLIGHIRNKFSGRQKRHNMLSVFSVVMVGLREWEKTPKNCDIMIIYDDNQVEQLRNIPNVKIEHIVQLCAVNTFKNNGSSKHDNTVVSTEEADDEEEEAQLDAGRKLPGNKEPLFNLKQTEEIDIDDI